MARLTTSEQDDALAALDRTTHVRVYVEDPDGTMQDVTDYKGENWLNECVIEATTDAPITRATISLWRRSGVYSIAPLIESSAANTDSAGGYAAFVNPHRNVRIEVATLLAGHPVASHQWVNLWAGIIDEVEWGGFASRVTLHCRDTLADLNDTIIEDVTEYGNDATTPDVEDVMQLILNAEAPSYTLATPVSPGFGVYAYELGRVSVLDALKALVDLFGWNLHSRWSDIADAHQLTLWEPNREATTADWTLGPDDYYDVRALNLNLAGIRNKIEVVYTDLDGDEQTVSVSDATSIAFYGTRFMRVDGRGTSIVTSTQASALASNLLVDLSTPDAVQEVESAFWWPLDLGDMVTYTANDEHYDTDQTWATFGYRHVLGPTQKRTFIQARGKPSGGYARWHKVEATARDKVWAGPSLEVTFDEEGHAVVSASGDTRTARIFIAVGDGADVAPPTSVVNNGIIEGQSGIVDTGVKITTGNDAHVRAISADERGLLSHMTSARVARRLGPFHQDTSSQNVGNTNAEILLDTVTISANRLGTNGSVHVTIEVEQVTTFAAARIRVALGGTNVLTHEMPIGTTGIEIVNIVIANRGATNSQIVVAQVHLDVVPFHETERTYTTKDSTADMALAIYGQFDDATFSDDVALGFVQAVYQGTKGTT